uniref:NADH-ubiquinone oxidoreductase chain 4L n=1 Tax=Staphylinoidea sp. 13 KM-2017 TaxID=2219453 RepID=A0A346RI50_9COLE|nr:NADH dehydrogenase subunit 4L [Staphylinoidea sp. 13 KM-2017]
MLILIFLMYFLGLIMFLKMRKHFLMMLLSLEFIVLTLYLNLYIFLNFFNHEFYFLMIFLVMSVCEGVLGIGLLVSMIRTHGNDYFQMLNILW